jgi:WXXGXW repeat (2 copies)
MRRYLTITLAALALTVGASGLALAQYPPPPPLRAEPPPPPPPGTRYVWLAGHWHWDGVRYIWRPGHYEVRRTGYHEFVPGHWAPRGGTWVWIPDGWR